MRFVGYPESQGEDPINIVKTVLSEKFGMENVAVDNAHRTGRAAFVAGVRRPRHLIFRVVNYVDKHEIMWKKREALKDVNYFITDDMTKLDLRKKEELKPVIDEAVRQRKKWKFRNGQLFIDDRLYRGDPSSSDVVRQHVVAAVSGGADGQNSAAARQRASAGGFASKTRGQLTAGNVDQHHGDDV